MTLLYIKSQVVFNYNFNRLFKSIPILKKSSTFIDILRFLIIFNDFYSRSINNNHSKFSYAFPKYLKPINFILKPSQEEFNLGSIIYLKFDYSYFFKFDMIFKSYICIVVIGSNMISYNHISYCRVKKGFQNIISWFLNDTLLYQNVTVVVAYKLQYLMICL